MLVNQKGLEPMMQLNVRVDRKVKEALEHLAKQDRRSLSEYIRLVLEDHILETLGKEEA